MKRNKLSYLGILIFGMSFCARPLLAQQIVPPTESKGLKIVKTMEVELGSEIQGVHGRRQMRLTLYRLNPSGIIQIHSHKGHRAVAYFIQGTLTEHRGDRIIQHRSGDMFAETEDITHWHQNLGKEPVLFVATEIFATQ